MGISLLQKGPLPSVNEDLPTSANEQALQDTRPSLLENLCLQQQQEEINGLIGTIKRLEQSFNEKQQSRDEHVKNLEARVEEMADTIERQASQQQSRDEHIKNLEARVERMADTIKRQVSKQQSHDDHVKNLEGCLQQHEKEGGILIGRFNSMIQHLACCLYYLEFQFVGLRGWVVTHLQSLTLRLVRCYVIAQ